MAKPVVYINDAVALSHLGLTSELQPGDFTQRGPVALELPNILYRPIAGGGPNDTLDSIIAQLAQVIDVLIARQRLSPADLANVSLFIGSSSLDIGALSEKNQRIWLTPLDTIAQALIEKYGFNALEFTVSTACTASANALLYAAKLIEQGQVEHALVIGCEFFNQLTVQGFESLELISRTTQRSLASDRDGLILGEGIGVVLLSAQRGEHAALKLLGGYSSCDTYSLTTTQEDGTHIQQVVKQAFVSAQTSSEQINLIKVHATASFSNDQAEVAALTSLFAPQVPPVFALKPYIGHTLGACGALELALLHQLCHSDFIPLPSYVSDDSGATLLPFVKPEQSIGTGDQVLLNHFGFGGNNACLIVEKVSVAGEPNV